MKSTASDLSNIVFKHSRAIIIFWMVTLLGVLVFYSQTKKNYDSKARVLVSMGSEAQGKAEYIDGKNLVLSQREEQVHNEQQILESHEVALLTAKWILGDATPIPPPPDLAPRIQEARRYFTGQVPESTLLLRAMRTVLEEISNLTENPKTHEQQVEGLAQSISKALTVSAIFNSDALDVSYRYRDPRVAQTVLQLVLAAYIDHHISVFQSPGEQDLLKSQLDLSVNQYQDRLSELAAYMVAHRVYTGDSQVDSMIAQREKLDQSYSEASADDQAQAARLKALLSLSNSISKYERYSTTEARNRQLEDLSTKLNNELVQEQAVLNLHPVGSRAYEDEQAKLNRLRDLIKQQPSQVVDQTEQRRSQASQLLDSDTVDATSVQRADQARLLQLRAQRDRIDSEINAYANSVGGYNMIKLQLNFAQQKSEQLGHAYVNSQLKSLTSQNAITDISIVDRPSWDWHPASPKKSIVAIATLGLLLIGTVAVVLAGIGLDDTFLDSRATASGLGLPVTATFPYIADKHDPDAPLDLLGPHTEQQFARLYQAVRSDSPDPHIILLASLSGAGASVIGYQMARFLSRMSGRKAGFVDCTAQPIEHPSNSDSAPDIPAILSWPKPTSFNQGAAAEALASITSWRQQFPYILIAVNADDIPVNLLSASHHVNSTFLLVEAGKTRQGAALQNLELLRSCGFAPIKLILNKSRSFVPNWLKRFV
jgi:uncharacterized protein involved in exopolysaccharide biosynthesis